MGGNERRGWAVIIVRSPESLFVEFENCLVVQGLLVMLRCHIMDSLFGGVVAFVAARQPNEI